MKFDFLRVVAVVGLACSAVPAHALNTRTWISGTGADGPGCGPIATPCRTLQYAHDNTSAGGEIDVKDSAGYGSVVITKAISIVGDGSISGVLASSGGNAITVNAATSDTVILRGLTVEGAGVGRSGVVLNTAGRLDIANCVFQNFSGSIPDGNGIFLQHSSGSPKVTIVNTTASHNSNAGILYRVFSMSTATVIVDRSTLIGNGDTGLLVTTTSMDGPSVNVTNTLSSANGGDGFYLTGSGLRIAIDQATATDNGRHGIFVASSASAVVGRSLAARNTNYGLNGGGSANLASFKNNQFFNNGAGATNGTIGNAALQ